MAEGKAESANLPLPKLGDRTLFPDLEPFAYLNHAAISPAVPARRGGGAGGAGSLSGRRPGRAAPRLAPARAAALEAGGADRRPRRRDRVHPQHDLRRHRGGAVLPLGARRRRRAARRRVPGQRRRLAPSRAAARPAHPHDPRGRVRPSRSQRSAWPSSTPRSARGRSSRRCRPYSFRRACACRCAGSPIVATPPGLTCSWTGSRRSGRRRSMSARSASTCSAAAPTSG